MVEYWLRRPPGSVSVPTDAGYDFVGGGSGGVGVGVDDSRMRLREHGYETVSDNVNRLPGYPSERMTGYPGSARLEPSVLLSAAISQRPTNLLLLLALLVHFLI